MGVELDRHGPWPDKDGVNRGAIHGPGALPGEHVLGVLELDGQPPMVLTAIEDDEEVLKWR